MPINTTWEDVIHRDQEEQDQAGRDADHRDAYRQQVDQWRRQISAGCPLHQAWIDIPIHQTASARSIPPQRLEHQSRNHQRASVDDDGNPLLWILPQQCCGEGEKHKAQQQQNIEPQQGAIRPLDVVEGYDWSCLPPFPVLGPGTTRVHSALLYYTLAVRRSSLARRNLAVLSLHMQALHEEQAREDAREASPKRMDRTEECV
jgi:hypothetical protein